MAQGPVGHLGPALSGETAEGITRSGDACLARDSWGRSWPVSDGSFYCQGAVDKRCACPMTFELRVRIGHTQHGWERAHMAQGPVGHLGPALSGETAESIKRTGDAYLARDSCGRSWPVSDGSFYCQGAVDKRCACPMTFELQCLRTDCQEFKPF